jgi:hypothetical protein
MNLVTDDAVRCSHIVKASSHHVKAIIGENLLLLE